MEQAGLGEAAGDGEEGGRVIGMRMGGGGGGGVRVERGGGEYEGVGLERSVRGHFSSHCRIDR